MRAQGSGPVVLVTGGAGYIGSHTMVVLLEAGWVAVVFLRPLLTTQARRYRVVCVDNYINSSPKAIDRVRAIVGSERAARLVAYRADVTRAEEVEAVLVRHGPDITHVIHFAGLKYADVGASVAAPHRPQGVAGVMWRYLRVPTRASPQAVAESIAQPVEYYRDNLDSTLVLLRALARHGITRVLFSSSATVYGSQVFQRRL